MGLSSETSRVSLQDEVWDFGLPGGWGIRYTTSGIKRVKLS